MVCGMHSRIPSCMVGQKGSAMLKTVPIEELQSGDLLPDGIGAPLDEGERNARTLIRDAMAVPTYLPGKSLYDRARTVVEVRTVGRMYVSVTMGTYAVVRLRKGSPVSVYRKAPNGPQDVSPAVVEAPPLDTVPADTEEVPYGPERQPFNYARSQFRQLGNYRETEYPTKLKIWNDNGETHWMNIHPDDLAALQRLMEAREDNS